MVVRNWADRSVAVEKPPYSDSVAERATKPSLSSPRRCQPGKDPLKSFVRKRGEGEGVKLRRVGGLCLIETRGRSRCQHNLTS